MQMIEKYFSEGYHCFPCKKASKATALEGGYSTIEYGEKGITEEQAAAWDKKFPIEKGYGIALICGKASNVLALDIDTDDLEVFKILPESPCVKRGQTGETRFFRYSDNYPKKDVAAPQIKLSPEIKDKVEILSNGQYTLLPPSIHEKTKQPYIWTGEDQLIFFSSNELPELPLGVLDSVRDYYAKKYGYAKTEKTSVELAGYFAPEKDRAAHGSHDRLKKLAAILANKELPIEVAVKELLDYDREHHGPLNYFKDKTRGPDAAADEETNALKFYSSMLHTINRERSKRGENPHKFLYSFNEIAPPKPIIAETKKEYPRARGIMGDVQKYCELMSRGKQDAVSLGGALALMSALCANKYRTQAIQYDVRSNMYIMNLAKSGAGKDIIQGLLKDLLAETPLLSSGSYKSSTSIIHGLGEIQERLNVMDECATFLKGVAQGEGYQQEINDVLCHLFSCSNKYFTGVSFAEKGHNFGACYNPSITILASTTMRGFKDAVNKSLADKGLMPRFLTLWQYKNGLPRRPTSKEISEADRLLKNIKKDVNNFLSIEKRIAEGFENPPVVGGKGVKYDPILVPMTDAAQDVYSDYADKYFPKDNQDETFEDAFRNRFAELAVKCALLDAVSLGLEEIDVDSIQWGIDVVEAAWANVRGVYKQTSAENVLEKNSLRMLEIIKTAPNGITQSELTRKTQWASKKQRQEILEDLQESYLISFDWIVIEGSLKKQKLWTTC